MNVNKERLIKAGEYFKEKLSFEEYLEKYNLLEGSVPTSQGVAICCIFHGDKDPSLKIDYGRNLYKCFGCGENGGGHIIHFIARYEKDILGINSSYPSVIERLLKSNRQYCVDLGFTTIYDDSMFSLDAIRKGGMKRFKLQKDIPKTFLDLSNYIKMHGTTDDMIRSIKLMQEGFSADIIFSMMFKIKSNSNVSSEFTGMSLDDLLKED